VAKIRFNFLYSMVVLLVLIFFVVMFTNVIVLYADTPICSNGDCPPIPSCSNGDCPPIPSCSNGDCPEEPPTDCCCVGSNVPGTTRVCCCRSADLDTVNCRDSLVLDNGDPNNFHLTIAEATLDGFRPERCDTLLKTLCDPPVEEVCTWRLGRRVCERVVKRICAALDQVCQYNFCGPTNWFPYDAAAPDLASCEWWDHIRECPVPEQQ
jgi:hypothetical protein